MRILHLQKRRGYWYYVRRIPDHAKSIDSRTWINRSTGIRVAHDPRGICARKLLVEFESEQEC